MTVENKRNINDILKSLFFLLYFVILTAERLISLSASLPDVMQHGFFLDIYMTSVTIISIIGGWGWLIVRGRALFRFASEKTGNDYLEPSIAAGILLFGGMVHTYGSIPPLQFVSYGFLLGAMALYTWQCVRADGKPVLRWLTFAYITAFSMAIPVVYKNDCEIVRCKLCSVFYPVEIAVSAGLVILFTIMLHSFFKNKGVSSFCLYAVLIAVIGDAAVLFLRWHSEINFFVLIFIIVAAMLWGIGKAAYNRQKRKNT